MKDRRLNQPPVAIDTSETAALQAQLAALQRHNDHLRASFNETFDDVGIGIVHVDLDGHFIEVNSAFCTMLGHKADDLVGRRFGEFTYDEDLEANLGYLNMVRNGQLSSYRMDKRYRRANGELFWADLVARAHLDAEGRPVRLVSAIVDITARKEFEERQKFLQGELAHRTQNLIAVISAITSQTAKSAATVPEMAKTLTSRLAGIAASQTALANAEMHDEASLLEVIRLQFASFLSPDDPRITLAGPEVWLAASPSRAIGMAIHELTTNALKYGALSTPDGAVDVSWHLPDADTFEIAWRESGGPPVSPPTRTGFGRRVIEQMVGASTSGEVRIDYRPEGMTWVLRAPVHAMLAQ